MSLGPVEVKKIAHLARLAIDGEDIPNYARDLSSILDLVAQMNKVDTSQAEAMAHPLHMAQRMRPDEPSEENKRAGFQVIAPQVEAGLYLVPKVIE